MTDTAEELQTSLEEVQRTGKAPCRLCGAVIDVSDADGWGDVFEALARHGERAHEWNDSTGWSE